MKIGLVLPDVPKYSETFFNYMIKGLMQAGNDVVVYSNLPAKGEYFFELEDAYPIFESKFIKQLYYFIFVLILTFLKSPSIVIKFYLLERQDGKSVIESLKSVYINAHILTESLDWLHFGFATMSVNKENVGKAIGSKVSVSLRGYDINVYPLKNPGCYNKLWQNIDKVHTISNYLHNKALTLGLSETVRFEKITPAIDIKLFNFKSEPGKINDPLRILTVGRLNWIKDYETAVSTMKILKDDGLNFIYNIIGTGNELERVKYAVYQSDLEDRINFLGRIDHGEINKYMLNSDIYLQTSLQEGFCVSVLEAQATGLLCITSDADGLKENIINEVTGWIVEKRKPANFAEKISKVINLPPDKRYQIAVTARKRVEEEFNIEDQINKFNKFFSN